jgi:hypothetical protein
MRRSDGNFMRFASVAPLVLLGSLASSPATPSVRSVSNLIQRASSVTGQTTASASPNSCTPYTLVSEEGIRSDGSLGPISSVNGRQSTFLDSSNREVHMLTFPEGWDASSASVAALKAFHVPLPPAGAQERGAWEKSWSGKRHTSHETASMCSGDAISSPPQITSAITSGGATAASQGSSNWSGRKDTSNGFSSITGTFNVPSYAAVCTGGQSSHATWVGIGGTQNNNLIQAGIDVTQNGVNGVSAFFEIPAYQPEQFVSSPSLSNGDLLRVDVWYDSTGPGGSANYQFWNKSTGTIVLYWVNYVGNFYDSTTVEWIDERTSSPFSPRIDGKYFYYRKTTTPVYWSDEYANGHVASYWHTDGLYMFSTQENATLATAALSSPTASIDYWQHC